MYKTGGLARILVILGRNHLTPLKRPTDGAGGTPGPPADSRQLSELKEDGVAIVLAPDFRLVTLSQYAVRQLKLLIKALKASVS